MNEGDTGISKKDAASKVPDVKDADLLKRLEEKIPAKDERLNEEYEVNELEDRGIGLPLKDAGDEADKEDAVNEVYSEDLKNIADDEEDEELAERNINDEEVNEDDEEVKEDDFEIEDIPTEFEDEEDMDPKGRLNYSMS